MAKRLLFAAMFLMLCNILGCAGMNYSYQGSNNPPPDCNGDVPSPYPPFCHPRH
jgi:hypothetical protein